MDACSLWTFVAVAGGLLLVEEVVTAAPPAAATTTTTTTGTATAAPPSPSPSPPPLPQSHKDGRCRCVCPVLSALLAGLSGNSGDDSSDGGGGRNGTLSRLLRNPSRQIYVEGVDPGECRCERVVLEALRTEEAEAIGVAESMRGGMLQVKYLLKRMGRQFGSF